MNNKKLKPNNRAQYLLKVLIQKYIADGTPVGSRTLLEDSGLNLSPATIRHVMSDLENHGLIKAPHTSSGRIPTPKGYRLFIDSLLQLEPLEKDEYTSIENTVSTLMPSNKDLALNVSSTA